MTYSRRTIIKAAVSATALSVVSAWLAGRQTVLADTGGANGPARFHIGIVTGSSNQGAEDPLGALEMIRLYGDARQGGMVRHVTYPDNFTEKYEDTTAIIAAMADDPLVKAVVVNQAVPGTAAGFRRIKEKRRDVICLAGGIMEDPDIIGGVADFAIEADFISRGYLIPHTAKRLGAKTFVHISFPRHMTYEMLSRRREIMEAACQDLGLRFVAIDAFDPLATSVAEARAHIMEAFPGWLQEYGEATAFFCTNDAHTAPLLKQIARYGGYFIEADIPSPMMGYPEAFDVDLSGETDDWAAILQKVEKAVVKAGGGGRMGTWAYSLGFCQTAGIAEFGRLIVEGKSTLSSPRDVVKCFERFSPGACWNGTFYTDLVTGKPMRTLFLVYQDTYIFGKGYMNATDVEIPDRFLSL
ncbi:MAG: DUF3798 domain-containing protein [Desulfobulbaceae bacterium]|jgi:hypothetical protein|nr:DUF3798 domain-containing protein [Desulfobulbaceae bacterium]